MDVGGAQRRSITRMKRKDVTTSKLAAPPFAYPQPVRRSDGY